MAFWTSTVCASALNAESTAAAVADEMIGPYLADAETKLKNFPQAEAAYEKYLQVATDPAAKAKTLLALGAAKISAHKPDEAQKIAEEIMSL